MSFKLVFCVAVTILVMSIVTTAIGPIDCNRPNEEYQCGSACQTECATLGETCPIVNIRCNDACYCKSEYARDVNQNCIPIADCPPKHYS